MSQIDIDFYSYFGFFYKCQKLNIQAFNSRAAGKRSDKNLKLIWK